MPRLMLYCSFLYLFIPGSIFAENQKNHAPAKTPVKREAVTTKKAYFAGGCFWCMEKPFDVQEGVLSTTSGYMGGNKKNADYKSVSSGRTKHYEIIAIEYNPQKIAYGKLLEIFWENIDPFDSKGQFCDKGPQYRAAIFFNDDQEKKAAELSKANLQKSFKEKIVTQVIKSEPFYPAEDYHQNYYKVNPIRYKYYRFRCGRDKRLKQVKQLLTTPRK